MLFRYKRSLLPHDALAGLVVALVLIYSAFAYADLANCTPAAGIYAALGGMVAFAIFTSSRHVIVGPRSRFDFLLRVSLENPQDILNRLRVLVRVVVGRHDLFGLSIVHVRTPVRHDAITGIG